MSMLSLQFTSLSCFFLNNTATTEIYTLSLHDALPIWGRYIPGRPHEHGSDQRPVVEERGNLLRRHPVLSGQQRRRHRDRKSTRLNSSHGYISYAVFCLKKKKIKTT